jgi:hypothetical protein
MHLKGTPIDNIELKQHFHPMASIVGMRHGSPLMALVFVGFSTREQHCKDPVAFNLSTGGSAWNLDLVSSTSIAW